MLNKDMLFHFIVNFVFFQVVEHGLGHLPFTEKQVITPTGKHIKLLAIHLR